jgi:hypothetical protein
LYCNIVTNTYERDVLSLLAVCYCSGSHILNCMSCAGLSPWS